MKRTSIEQSFFGTTRGRIVSLLLPGDQTADDLAGALGLTDNAVRAHLDALLLAGLVERRVERKGPRKPSYAYGLTPKGEQLFPKAYPALLNRLLVVLKRRMHSRELDSRLVEAARNFNAEIRKDGDVGFDQKVAIVLRVLESLGAEPVPETVDDAAVIRSHGVCPWMRSFWNNPRSARWSKFW